MKEIINELTKNGYEAYIVGGYVRDYLLGINSTDIDICTNAPIDEIIKIFDGRGEAYKEYFSYHIEEEGFSYDITTYRRELRYKKNKPVAIEIAPNLKTDLKRRDFTINTFAIDKDGIFVDLLGAKKDLDSKIIKVVGDTEKKLREDKTRIIRAIRFACTLDFDLDDEIINFIKDKKVYLLNEVPKEYKRKELDIIFESRGINRFFFLLRRYDISKYFNLKINKVKPAYNKYGVWAQLETDLPFSNKEKLIISLIKSLINKGNITIGDMMIYSDEVVYNAASVLGLEKKVKVFEEIMKLHSIIEIDVDLEMFFKYCSMKDIVKTYRLVEKSIMLGSLDNNKYAIEEFLRNM